MMMDNIAPDISFGQDSDGSQDREALVTDSLEAFEKQFHVVSGLRDIAKNNKGPSFDVNAVGIGGRFGSSHRLPSPSPESQTHSGPPTTKYRIRAHGEVTDVAQKPRSTQTDDTAYYKKSVHQASPIYSDQPSGSVQSGGKGKQRRKPTPANRITLADASDAGEGSSAVGGKRKRERANEKLKHKMGHMPDLFWVHKPSKYMPWGYDCSYGKLVSDWIKNWTAKHWAAGHFHEEFGTDAKAEEKYLAVLLVNLEPAADDESWYRALRQALWGTPLNAALPKCPDEGQHKLCTIGIRQVKYPPIKKPKKSLIAASRSGQTVSQSRAALLATTQLAEGIASSSVTPSLSQQSKSTHALQQENDDLKEKLARAEAQLVQMQKTNGEKKPQPVSNTGVPAQLPPVPTAMTLEALNHFNNAYAPADLHSQSFPTQSGSTSPMSTYFMTNDRSSITNVNDFEYPSNKYGY